MNKKMKIIISTIIIFLFSSASLFTYYRVYEHQEIVDKYVIRTIKWDDYNANKPQSKIKIFNTNTKEYEEYQLDDINLNEISSISKDIVKEVQKYSNIKLEKEDFPQLLEFDQNTQLKLSNIIVEPIITKEKSWQDEIESKVKNYTNLENADLINIPKEIYENNETWSLLTDSIKFDNLEDKYNCTASYHHIKRVEEEKSSIDNYFITAVYSGKTSAKTGNVILRYKLSNLNTNIKVSPYFSSKTLILSIIMFIILFFIIVSFKNFFKRIDKG
jgi:hypothetical protein